MNALVALRRGLRRAVLDQPLVWRIVESTWPYARPLPLAAKRQLDQRMLQRLPKDQVREMLLRRMPKNGVCVEIGVWKGDFSDRILRITRPRELHLIDPWAFQPQFPKRMYSGNLASSQLDMDAICDGVRQRFAELKEVRVHRRFSGDLPEILQGVTLDWVYIDGNHSKAFVRQDLDLCWRALRRGGYITGDDYSWQDLDGSYGVREAVDEFATDHRLRVELIGGQYLIRKP
jgi:Methyltransferase domain